MEKNVSERLSDFISYLNISARRFEREIGVANGFVKAATSGMGVDKIRRISKVYPTLNTDWLLTGEGPMLKVGAVQRAGGNSTQVAGNSNNVNNGATLDKALDEIAEQRKLVASSQAQIDRLLAIIENMTARN